ncbi:CorA metal ion transporter [Gamsiella multidivaricata]|nr:CorA metal ion transporter [Gamsiella multidivaricata]
MPDSQEGRSQSLTGVRGLERTASMGSTSVFGGSVSKRRSARKASYYSERAARPPLQEQWRYTFYSRTTGMVQAASLPKILTQASLQADASGMERPKVFSDLLKDGCFWIDILDPEDVDMHLVHRFHFRPSHHHLHVLHRLEQFHSHITLTPDWINYALLDDITDSFASPIQTIEYEVDSIDELVLLLRENETSDMLRRIGSCRKNVMTISRLLTNKADVIRGLMKRFDERFIIASGGAWGNAGAGTAVAIGAEVVTATGGPRPGPGPREVGRDPIIGGAGATPILASAATGQQRQQQGAAAAGGGGGGRPLTPTSPALNITQPYQQALQPYRDGEILLYLGDILDHVLTMLQSLYSYEKVLARSHSNYLAQISLEINQLSNKTNNVVGTLTFFASLIVPMTFVAGLWGMNVHVPGQPGDEDEPLHWWWGLCGFMGLYCIVAVFFGKRYGLI